MAVQLLGGPRWSRRGCLAAAGHEAHPEGAAEQASRRGRRSLNGARYYGLGAWGPYGRYLGERSAGGTEMAERVEVLRHAGEEDFVIYMLGGLCCDERAFGYA